MRKKIPIEKQTLEKQKVLRLLGLRVVEDGDFPIGRGADFLMSRIIYQSLSPNEKRKWV